MYLLKSTIDKTLSLDPGHLAYLIAKYIVNYDEIISKKYDLSPNDDIGEEYPDELREQQKFKVDTGLRPDLIDHLHRLGLVLFWQMHIKHIDTHPQKHQQHENCIVLILYRTKQQLIVFCLCAHVDI